MYLKIMAHPVFVNLNRSEEHTSELQSLRHLVCRLLLEKKTEPQTFSARKETPADAVVGIKLRLSVRQKTLPPASLNAARFFFNDTATTGIYPFSLPVALPI